MVETAIGQDRRASSAIGRSRHSKLRCTDSMTFFSRAKSKKPRGPFGRRGRCTLQNEGLDQLSLPAAPATVKIARTFQTSLIDMWQERVITIAISNLIAWRQEPNGSERSLDENRHTECW